MRFRFGKTYKVLGGSKPVMNLLEKTNFE